MKNGVVAGDFSRLIFPSFGLAFSRVGFEAPIWVRFIVPFKLSWRASNCVSERSACSAFFPINVFFRDSVISAHSLEDIGTREWHNTIVR